MVVHQVPNDERGRRIIRMAEASMTAAGMKVIPSAPYLDRMAKSGRSYMVHEQWEGHPSAEAHEIFAAELVDALLSDERIVAGLTPFARAERIAAGAR
jgi:hypothetical protein